jgi:hypothetical protein
VTSTSTLGIIDDAFSEQEVVGSLTGTVDPDPLEVLKAHDDDVHPRRVTASGRPSPTVTGAMAGDDARRSAGQRPHGSTAVRYIIVLLSDGEPDSLLLL